jgi:hypothetical protein
MLGAGGDKHRMPVAQLDPMPFDVKRAAAFEDDVDLVIGVWLLVVSLGCDQHVDADLETGRLVDNLVATVMQPPGAS